MGGLKQTMVATLIDGEVMKEAHWNLAAALGVLLLLFTFAGLLLIQALRRMRRTGS
jgi:putative spermidine/putrescine transport system permease protein